MPAIQPAAMVKLNDLQPLPTPAVQQIQPLRVAIAAVISPQGSAESYAPLLEYLSEKLGRPVESVQRRTYAEVNELVRTGDVDIAFVCTSSYLVGKRDFGMQLLVAPQVHGKIEYHSLLIVPSGSPASSIADLQGKVFAFTDPLSFTGRIVPTYWLNQLGQSPESFFKHTFFTYSHDDAIQSVVTGVADGAAIDSLVFDFALARNPDLANQVRVIQISAPFGIPPVVVGPNIRPQLRAQLEEILLNMHLNSQGLAALQALDYDKFVLISESAYLSAQKIQDEVRIPAEQMP